jgi:co-chaperonin GroES (HSP10)
MSLIPLGHRILVKPDTPPDQSGSGLILPQDRDHIPNSGTVVAVGPGGNQMRYRTRQRAIGDCVEVVESAERMWGHLAALQIVRENISALLGTSEPEREVHVGDRVAFGSASGVTYTEDGEEYIVLNEDDVAVLVAEEAAA